MTITVLSMLDNFGTYGFKTPIYLTSNEKPLALLSLGVGDLNVNDLIEYDGILTFTNDSNKPVWVGAHLRLGSKGATDGLNLSSPYGFGSNITPEPGEHHKPYFYSSRMMVPPTTTKLTDQYLNFVVTVSVSTMGNLNYLTANGGGGRLTFKRTPAGS